MTWGFASETSIIGRNTLVQASLGAPGPLGRGPLWARGSAGFHASSEVERKQPAFGFRGQKSREEQEISTVACGHLRGRRGRNEETGRRSSLYRKGRKGERKAS